MNTGDTAFIDWNRKWTNANKSLCRVNVNNTRVCRLRWTFMARTMDTVCARCERLLCLGNGNAKITLWPPSYGQFPFSVQCVPIYRRWWSVCGTRSVVAQRTNFADKRNEVWLMRRQIFTVREFRKVAWPPTWTTITYFSLRFTRSAWHGKREIYVSTHL